MCKLSIPLLIWILFLGIDFPALVENNQYPYEGLSLYAEPMIMENGVSVPSDFPHIEVFVNDQPDSGKIFLNNYNGPPYMMILENSGAPYYYQKTEKPQRDFKVQPNGMLTYRHRPTGSFQGMDSAYNVIKTFKAGKGWSVDEHELQVLENNHYFIIALKDTVVDMSRIVTGGKTNATVKMSALQEFDDKDNLLLHWSAWDHFHPKDMIGYSYDDLPTHDSFRFVHMNAIDIDDDGHIVLSSKRISEITKIHRHTGQIIWRLGGANNEFTFIDDPLDGFYTQHDISCLGDGRYMLFDNGNLHDPPVSRAVEYELDTLRMTAKMIWEFRENTFAYHMGNAQRLPNGNTLINWAVKNLPKITEVSPDGRKVYEMNFVDRYKTYRAFRFRWKSTASKPYLIVESFYDHIALIFNQFGAPSVSYYRIYGGPSPHPTTVLDTSALTLKKITNLENNRNYYFRVTSVDMNGHESEYSNEEKVLVNIVPPGTNMVLNGDFSEDDNNWDFNISGDADADGFVEEGVYHIQTIETGNQFDDIQLKQENLNLIQGKTYTFEFDGWSSKNMFIEARLERKTEPFINYGKIGISSISQQKEHFQYTFEMNDPSDEAARVVFNCNDKTGDLFIDNISLKQVVSSQTLELKPQVPSDYHLDRVYPNPFNDQTTIRFFVEHPCQVMLSIYNARGQWIHDLVQDSYALGNHQVRFNGERFASGTYFVRLLIKQKTGGWKGYGSIKMILLR